MPKFSIEVAGLNSEGSLLILYDFGCGGTRARMVIFFSMRVISTNGDGPQVLTVHHYLLIGFSNRPNSVVIPVVVHCYHAYNPTAGYNLFGANRGDGKFCRNRTCFRV